MHLKCTSLKNKVISCAICNWMIIFLGSVYVLYGCLMDWFFTASQPV